MRCRESVWRGAEGHCRRTTCHRQYSIVLIDLDGIIRRTACGRSHAQDEFSKCLKRLEDCLRDYHTYQVGLVLLRAR